MSDSRRKTRYTPNAGAVDPTNTDAIIALFMNSY